MVPADLMPKVLDASARLGVDPRAMVKAALTRQLDLVTEDEAAACEDDSLYEDWRRKRDADRAKRILENS